MWIDAERLHSRGMTHIVTVNETRVITQSTGESLGWMVGVIKRDDGEDSASTLVCLSDRSVSALTSSPSSPPGMHISESLFG